MEEIIVGIGFAALFIWGIATGFDDGVDRDKKETND